MREQIYGHGGAVEKGTLKEGSSGQRFEAQDGHEHGGEEIVEASRDEVFIWL